MALPRLASHQARDKEGALNPELKPLGREKTLASWLGKRLALAVHPHIKWAFRQHAPGGPWYRVLQVTYLEETSNSGVQQKTFGVFNAAGQADHDFIRNLPNDFAGFFVGHGHNRPT